MTARSGQLWRLFALASALLLYAAASAQNRAGSALKSASPHVPAPGKPDTFSRDIAPLIKTFCLGCHSGSNPPAGLSLTGYSDADSVVKARAVWEKVAANVGSNHMPPESAPHPTDAQRSLLVSWIDSTFTAADCNLHDPGHVTLRRLNREEYNNTVHDLLDVDLRPADDFPADDVGYNFDNIGDVLSLSPLLMERYLDAAEKVARAAILAPEDAARPIRYTSVKLPGAVPETFSGISYHLFATEGEIGVDYVFPQMGRYTFRARAFGQQAGPEPARMGFRLDGNQFSVADVKAVENAPQVYEASATVSSGKHHFTVAFVNDYYRPGNGKQKAEDRNLAVDYLEIQPPPHVRPLLPESHRRIFFCRPTPATQETCARKILAALARRAYRRPVSAEEVTRLLRYVHLAKQEGQSFERGIQLALEAMLVSPNFLFHVEIDPKPNDAKAAHPVDSYALASRLSYFLWSSMPDEELFTLAAKGKLQESGVMAAQVRRMLQDPKARTLADNFAGQWLQLRKLERIAPDRSRFPDFNDALRRDMRTETALFFEAVVKEDRSVLDFVDGRFTYLNERLARHYGIPGMQGDSFRRMDLDGVQRSGVLTQASVLTVTSNPTRTSPVKRGKWILEQFLGAPPPAPPPGVGVLPDEQGDAVLTGTLRQRMEEHRRKPLCASCHARMDPLGFGLENYDAVGAWRTKDGKLPVDASGTLPEGQSFTGPAQLKAILMAKKTAFVRCLAEKLLTYALGRGIEPYDHCNLDTIGKQVARHDYRFSALVTAIVQSEPFRLRRGEGGKQPDA